MHATFAALNDDEDNFGDADDNEFDDSVNIYQKLTIGQKLK